jgi:hypothetical protein
MGALIEHPGLGLADLADSPRIDRVATNHRGDAPTNRESHCDRSIVAQSATSARSAETTSAARSNAVQSPHAVGANAARATRLSH